MKKFKEIIISFLLFFLVKIKSQYYLSLKLVTIDDCVRNINVSNSFVMWKFDPNNLNECDFAFQNIYPEYFTKYYNYQLGTKIQFEFQDSVHVDAFVNIKVYFNEYIIKASDQRFWKCEDCYTPGGNYIWDNVNDRMDLRVKTNGGYIYGEQKAYLFHCYFQIDSYADVYKGNFEVNSAFYSLNDKKYFYYRIPYTQNELELINFNTTENFYVSDNKTLSIDCTKFFFKIIYINQGEFNGQLNALGLDDLDLNLNTNYDFKISNMKGIRYTLIQQEKDNKEVTIKVKITAYNNANDKNYAKQVSIETEFFFIITIFDDIETTLPIIETTQPIIQTTLPIIETTQPLIQTTQIIIETTQPIIETTMPVIETTLPEIETTQLLIPTTQPIIETTVPLIKTTQPIIETTLPIIKTTQPIIETTLPIIDISLPIIETTLPIIKTTQPIVPTTYPLIETTFAIIPTTQFIILTTQPIIQTTQPIIETTQPIIVTTLPIIETTQPNIPTTQSIIETTHPFIETTNPFIQTTVPKEETDTQEKETFPEITEKIIHCLDEDQFISYDEKNKIYYHICPTYNTEEIMANIKEIINKIDIDKNYKIQAQNYIAQVSPINYLDPDKNNAIFFPLTYANFTECEKTLREEYGINSSRKITFIEIQTNNTIDDILVNEIDYQAYDDEKSLLSLSLCENKNKNIKVYCSIKEDLINEIDLVNAFKAKGIDILDINDPFFNDVCLPYSSSGKDLTLNDRIEEIYKNYTYCEKNCQIDKVDFQNKTITCDCTIKSNFTVKDLNFELIEYKLEKKKSNFKITKCLNKLGSLKDNLDNIGFWIFLGLFILNILLLFCFGCLGIKPLEAYLKKEMADNGYIKRMDEGHAFCHNYIKKLDALIERLNVMKKNYNNNIKEESNPPPKHKTHIIKSTRSIRSEKSLIDRKKTKVKTHIKSSKDLENNIEIIKKRMDKTKKQTFKSITKIPIRQSTKEALFDDSKRANLKKTTESVQNKLTIKEKGNDFELNLININLKDLKKRVFIPNESRHILNIYDYNDAIKYEKRSLCRIYYMFLIAKQIIMHVIFYKSPIEPLPLRISLLISVFQCDLALNAFFYTDDKVSENHKSAKNIIAFAFTNNIIVILLSTLIGYIFLTFFNNLNNTTNEIRKIFRREEEKMKNDVNYKFTIEKRKEILLEIKSIMRKFKIKVIIFYIIEITIMIFYWYYSTMFCFVYNKTQISWLIDTFVSIFVRIIIDLVLNMILSLLYKLSVKFKSSCLFSVITCYYCFS